MGMAVAGDGFIFYVRNCLFGRARVRARVTHLFAINIIIIFIVGFGGLAVGYSFGQSNYENCVYDAVFHRWECCRDTIETPNGLVCAVGQPVRILNANP